MRKLILLDRDGVINDDADPSVFKPIPGALEALRMLDMHGYTVAVVTNQSGVGRGLYSLAHMHAVNDLFTVVDHTFYCPHAPEDGCDCRKPKTGLFKQVEQHYGITLSPRVWMVGDALRDVEAGHAAGCTPVLVMTGKPVEHIPTHTMVFADLMAVARYLTETP